MLDENGVLTVPKQALVFTCLLNISLLKTLWEKEKLLLTSNFSFSHSVFYPFGELAAFSIEFRIVICKTFSGWKSPKFVVWERVNAFVKSIGQADIHCLQIFCFIMVTSIFSFSHNVIERLIF